MNYLNVFLYSISAFLFCFLFLQSSYLFLFATAGRLMSPKRYKHATTTGRFVIYLFCNRDEEAASAVKSLLSLNYPGAKKHIVVISRSLSSSTKLELQSLPVQCIHSNHTHSKAKALQTALQQTDPDFDYALLLDAKHICTKGFLYRINDVLQSGCRVVQGQRVVRNTANVFGLLDAISEGVDTHIFCKSQQLLGLSSSLTNSGVGIEFSLLCNMMTNLPAAGTLIKEAELYLLRKNIRIAYAPKAFLYEERKSRFRNTEQKYEDWMTAKSVASKACQTECIAELCKGNTDFLNKIFQHLLLPRILLLGITPLLVLLSATGVPGLSLGYWLVLWILTYTAIFMSMPAKYITNRFFRAVVFVPALFISTTKMFLGIKKKHPSLYAYSN